MTGFGAPAYLLAEPVIQLVEWQVEQMGGIKIGGVSHPLDIIPYDMESSVSGATKASSKAILQDKVTAVVWGGLSGADGYGVASVSDPAGVPFFHYMGEDGLNTEYKYTVESALGFMEEADDPAYFVRDNLKPKTVAFLSWQNKADMEMSEAARKVLEAAGVKTVYKEFYASGTTDFSSFITKIRFENPDVLMSCGYTSAFVGIVNQMMSLGGWGKTKFVSITGAGSVISTVPGGEGMYSEAYWVPGQTTTGAKAFEDAWTAYYNAHPGWKGGKSPDSNNVPFYMCLWTAIHAIELANSTNPADVAKAARSGNLAWDSPCGPLKVTPDGFNSAHPIIVQVQSGKLVKVAAYTDATAK